MLELTSVSKRFGSTQALSDVSLEARDGEIFGLLGPNGAGKTTAIRLVLKLYLPDTGSVTFDGRPLEPGIRERIGYLPEERGLYPKEKLREVLLYLASLKGASRPSAREATDRWLERFGLLDHAGAKVESLSKGMHHKAQFIAAVAHDPDIVILDEPFAGLDPVSVELLRKAILELKQAGKTILFSTHVMDQAERLCNRVAIIDRGRLIVSGSLAEIKARHGMTAVQVEFDGDGEFITDLPEVADVTRYPRYVEVALHPRASANDLLSALLPRLHITRFEVLSPSLHRIFLDKVGGARTDAGGEDT
ncbi:MAG: ATP-binding cassette domain-containing protein [Spirochaetia bacterium]